MTRYGSFLVRIWGSNAGGGPQWSIQVVNLQQKVTQRFTHPEALVAYLCAVNEHGDPAWAAAEAADHERREPGHAHEPPPSEVDR
jgi:hypothetical protein